MKVHEIMKQPVITVHEDATLSEVAQTMLDHHVWGVPVINDRGEITGIVTEADFAVKEAGMPFSTFRAPQLFGKWMDKGKIEKLYEAARTMKAKEVMSSPVITVTEDASIENVVQLMVERHITRIPVVREKIPVGIVARNDLLKLMAGTSSST
ncbi:MAG: CBS domain-containing protein [Acidobacteriota bacterium]